MWQYRTIFKLGNGIEANVLTGKVESFAHIDSLMRVRHPTPKILHKLEKTLNKMGEIERFWLSKWEPTFDIKGDGIGFDVQLMDLMKKTMYLRHGRKSFSCSDDQDDSDETFYINFRTAVKQTRLYPKPVTHGEDQFRSARFEFPFKKRKLHKQKMEKPTDILKYDLGVLDEIGFYGIDEIKVKRSLLEYDTDHWFSRRLTRWLNRDGFHATQYWARRRFRCPVSCAYRNTKSCKLHKRRHNLQNGLDKYLILQQKSGVGVKPLFYYSNIPTHNSRVIYSHS